MNKKSEPVPQREIKKVPSKLTENRTNDSNLNKSKTPTNRGMVRNASTNLLNVKNKLSEDKSLPKEVKTHRKELSISNDSFSKPEMKSMSRTPSKNVLLSYYQALDKTNTNKMISSSSRSNFFPK